MAKSKELLRVIGAREHNLKNVSVDIPKQTLTVLTGLSGSGKSSLAFDTIYAEGQRRYVESLSAYARQFLGVMEKPDVDAILGLSPAISIDQKSTSRNPRSTVGTVTEIYDYLRLLYARIGQPHCAVCHQHILQLSASQIAERVAALMSHPRNVSVSGEPRGWPKFMLLSPLVTDKKGEHKGVIDRARRAGFGRLRIDGQVMPVEEAEGLELNKQKKHTIEVVVDRLSFENDLSEDDRLRLSDSVEKALDLAEGTISVLNADTEEIQTLSSHFACPDHPETTLPEIEPRLFSFNSPHGACPTCQGLGVLKVVDPAAVMPNQNLSLAEGAIRPWIRSQNAMSWYDRLLERFCRDWAVPYNTPTSELTEAQTKLVLFGTPSAEGKYPFEGVIPNLERRYKETESDFIRAEIERYMIERPCPSCRGQRLKPEVLGITVGGQNIAQATALDIASARAFFADLKLTPTETQISKLIIKEILERLSFLENVGLSYLTLSRAAASLSGGEAQRIRLATQIGSSLSGVLYVLDEPSIGLHQRDNGKLLVALKNLRDLGNTVLVVEHDEETMAQADYLIDIGPGAGKHGGEIVAAGTYAQFLKKPSLTADYLSGRKTIAVPKIRRPGLDKYLSIVGATANNLKNITAKIPLGTLTVVSGVSGSGKSTLINDILARALRIKFHHAHEYPSEHKEILGTEHLDKVIAIDQSPIGRTPRSNPATYTGVFTAIRALFASTPEAKLRGYKEGRFSFNVKGGRCETCHGDGVLKIEMHFLPDVYVTCPECHGQRYNREALEIRYKGKNIAEVLEMTVEEALKFFAKIPYVKTRLQTLVDVGLSYMHLGQSATTLSGGEAQRLKLATELARRGTGKTLYILDEPTTGLHFEDTRKLLLVLHALVDKGNTVLVIEHNLDVIKNADWVIDLGPEGGQAGGQIIAKGTPETVAECQESATGEYLRRVLA